MSDHKKTLKTTTVLIIIALVIIGLSVPGIKMFKEHQFKKGLAEASTKSWTVEVDDTTKDYMDLDMFMLGIVSDTLPLEDNFEFPEFFNDMETKLEDSEKFSLITDETLQQEILEVIENKSNKELEFDYFELSTTQYIGNKLYGQRNSDVFKTDEKEYTLYSEALVYSDTAKGADYIWLEDKEKPYKMRLNEEGQVGSTLDGEDFYIDVMDEINIYTLMDRKSIPIPDVTQQYTLRGSYEDGFILEQVQIYSTMFDTPMIVQNLAYLEFTEDKELKTITQYTMSVFDVEMIEATKLMIKETEYIKVYYK